MRAGDTVVEIEGRWEGNEDTVRAGTDYTLAPGVQVEILRTIAKHATKPIDLTGNEYSQKIIGNDGANTLDAGDGNDSLFGLGGTDTLIGGAGNDRFNFRSMADTTVAAPDHIADFSSGDLIDISWIPGRFTFIGTAEFDHNPTELRVEQMPDGTWLVQGDYNGDGAADFAILVTSASALTSSDFVL